MTTLRISGLLCLMGLAAVAFTSCVQNHYYNTNPNNGYSNGYNNTDTGYNYVFDEEFNTPDKYGWTFTDSTDSAYAGIINGSYQYVDYGTILSNMSEVNTGANTQGNFIVTTRFKSNKLMALVFGGSSSDNGYAFYIDSAGNYSLYKEGIGGTASTVVIPSTQDTLYALKNNWNTLELDQVNGNWTAFINGTQVFQMAARSLSGSDFGYKILPGTSGYADYLIVKSH